MQITSIGHAGLFVETNAGRILCDPWFNPAYFGSWFPFPDNSDIDPCPLGEADYLYISHLHHDHFDPEWLSEYMSKSTRILLPEYPVNDLRDCLEDLGFRYFIQTRNLEPVELDSGLQVMINSLTSPADGPIGDSAIIIDDGRVRVFNQNDARPTETERIKSFGPIDAHFLQYSGAIWYPMVYDFPQRAKDAMGRRKRVNGMNRALKYIEEYQAPHAFPFAGPPCFLDPDLFHLNDLDGDETNIFPDQWSFLEYAEGRTNAELCVFIPGTKVSVQEGGRCSVEQVPSATVEDITRDRGDYLRRYQQRKHVSIREIRSSWPSGRSDILSELKEWIEPLLAIADLTCEGVGDRVLLEVEDADSEDCERIVVDFLDRRVDRWNEEKFRYRFCLPRPLVEMLVQQRTVDWANELFLSCRFKASRKGPFNEYVMNFFAALSVDRVSYIEKYYADLSEGAEIAVAGPYVVQRYCPHLGADLTKFGLYDNGTVICQLHGWEFDASTGDCLTSSDRRLDSQPAAKFDDLRELPTVPSVEDGSDSHSNPAGRAG